MKVLQLLLHFLKPALGSLPIQLLSALTGLAILSACNPHFAASDMTTAPRLEHTRWTLSRIDNKPFTAARLPTLEFEANKIAGYSGCNRFAGLYTQGTSNTLSMAPLSSTRMACLTESAEIEQHIHHALEATTYYQIQGKQLLLLDANHKLLLTYQASPETKTPTVE